ncbi:hypothetical protein [Kitasatospora sp. NPDC088351]|uniref:hypothetical protein n=1 Tax=Kitasatospora sp. NPDC088351 TaxID=3155180 RepID=UPI003428CEDC
MRIDDALNEHDEVRTLLAAGLGAEPPLRADTVGAAVAAGRRRGTRRRLARAGAGVAATAALTALVVATPGTGGAPAAPGTPGPAAVAAADPLAGPLVLAGSAGDAPQTLRPDSFGPGTGHPTDWTSRQLGDALAGLLPSGATTVREGDIPGRTFRVDWDGGTGPVEFIGGADRTADAPKVPFCARIALPKVTARPGVPAPADVVPTNDCQVVELADGARAETVTLTFPQDGRGSQYVRVQRADGRTVTLQQWTARPEAALETAALLAIANDPAWRF